MLPSLKGKAPLLRIHNATALGRQCLRTRSFWGGQLRRAVEVLEVMGELVLNDAIPDVELRSEIFGRIPNEEMTTLVDGCRQLRTGDDGSHLSLTAHWYGYTREYSPALLDKTPFRFAEQSALGRAVAHLRLVNREHRRKLGHDAPTDFLPPRWRRYVVGRNASGAIELSRPHYELALLTTLNEQLKSGDVTVARSRRWTDFEEYLIPAGCLGGGAGATLRCARTADRQ